MTVYSPNGLDLLGIVVLLVVFFAQIANVRRRRRLEQRRAERLHRRRVRENFDRYFYGSGWPA